MKILKGLIAVFFVIVSVLVIFKLGAEIYYKDFYSNATRGFEIPGLKENFVPQGLTYSSGDELFFISGYLSDSKAARIYIVSEDGSYRMVKVKDKNGYDFLNHFGGISLYGRYAYVAGCDGKCYVISVSELLNVDAEYVSVLGSFEPGNKADFCSVYNGYLFVGEYYNKLKYTTDESHHIKTPSGEENRAMMMSFLLDDSKPYGVTQEASYAYSVKDRIQGIAFSDNGEIILSASGVFTGSQLYVYDFKKVMNGANDSFTMDNQKVPLYYLDSSSFIQKVEILPKSEGITFNDGNLYMIFESAANRFKFGKLLNTQYLYILLNALKSHLFRAFANL